MFKKIFKQLIPPIIWNSNRAYRAVKGRQTKYFGCRNEDGTFLDQKLEKYLNYTEGFFVELGANNGIDYSNSMYFEKYKNWSGILIEPSPENYVKCLANRAICSKIFCNACVSFDYKEKFIELVYANLMSTPIGVESDIFDPQQHANQLNDLHQAQPIFGAVATTLTKILEDALAPRVIDLLSLDVEGAEIEVLKGINHEYYRFHYMVIESRDIDKISQYLQTVNYELVEKLSHHDYLFKNVKL